MKYKTSTPTPPRTVLAIDPGFDRVGIAVLTEEGPSIKLVFSECLKTNPKEHRADRLLLVGNKLKQIIRRWQPNVLVVETLFFNTNATSALGVAEARGVITYEAKRAGLEIFEYAPQSVKIAVTGYGKAGKRQVALMVKRLMKISDKSSKLDDETDAIALGITHLATKKTI